MTLFNEDQEEKVDWSLGQVLTSLILGSLVAGIAYECAFPLTRNRSLVENGFGWLFMPGFSIGLIVASILRMSVGFGIFIAFLSDVLLYGALAFVGIQFWRNSRSDEPNN